MKLLNIQKFTHCSIFHESSDGVVTGRFWGWKYNNRFS